MFPHDSIHIRATLKVPIGKMHDTVMAESEATAPAPPVNGASAASFPMDVADFLAQFDKQFESAKASADSSLK